MRLKDRPDRFLSFAEVAEILGLDEKTLRNGECGTDDLARIKLGVRTVFSFNDVQAWISRRVRQSREHKSQIEIKNLAQDKSRKLQRRGANKGINIRLIK